MYFANSQRRKPHNTQGTEVTVLRLTVDSQLNFQRQFRRERMNAKEELMMKALIDIYPRMRKKVVLFPPYFFFDYKNLALFVLRAVLSCL